MKIKRYKTCVVLRLNRLCGEKPDTSFYTPHHPPAFHHSASVKEHTTPTDHEREATISNICVMKTKINFNEEWVVVVKMMVVWSSGK